MIFVPTAMSSALNAAKTPVIRTNLRTRHNAFQVDANTGSRRICAAPFDTYRGAAETGQCKSHADLTAL
jgi:hypothetical protein